MSFYLALAVFYFQINIYMATPISTITWNLD